MKIAATGENGEFHVWAMLDDDAHNHDPRNRGESFVIGSGETLDHAFDDARRDLERALGDVEVMKHDTQQPGSPCQDLVANGLVMTRTLERTDV